MNTKQPDIAHLLRDVANEMRESATYPPLHTWEDGHAMDARAAHDEYLAAAEAVEALIAENETLHAENETLRTGLDAARLEIESLKGQLEAVGADGVSPLIGASQAQPAAQAQPVAGQSRFKGDDEWGWCSHEHVTMVLATPSAWEGYEVRYLYASPQPAAQALDSVRVFWQQHTQADALSMTVAELHDDVELVIRAAPSSAAPQPAAQAGEYPELPDLYSTGAPFWRAVLAWHDAHHGPEAINAADKLDMLVADMLRAYVDADRAARGAAQAAPVVADVQDEECDVPPFGWRCTREKDHEGPCAAVESPEDKSFVERGMRRIRDAEDAGRYRLLKRGQHWSVIDGAGNTLRAEVLDVAVDAAIAAQQVKQP